MIYWFWAVWFDQKFIVFNSNDLNFDRKGASFHLILPFFYPGIWTDLLVCRLEVLARLIVGAAQFLATIEIQKHLVAITCLVLIRESRIEWSRGKIIDCYVFRSNFLSHCKHLVLSYLKPKKKKWLKFDWMLSLERNKTKPKRTPNNFWGQQKMVIFHCRHTACDITTKPNII